MCQIVAHTESVIFGLLALRAKALQYARYLRLLGKLANTLTSLTLADVKNGDLGLSPTPRRIRCAQDLELRSVACACRLNLLGVTALVSGGRSAGRR
jgi:hypothetical protein